MQFIIDVLKSKGKLGGAGLMLLGVGQVVLVYLGKMPGSVQDGVTVFLLGLAAFGIRSKLDAK